MAGGTQTCVRKTGCNVQECDTCEAGRENTCQTCNDGYLLFLGNCFPCEFPCSVCTLNINAVMATEVVPFIQPLQAASLPTPPGTQPHYIDMFTIDLMNIPDENKPWITLGYFIYDIVDNYVHIEA